MYQSHLDNLPCLTSDPPANPLVLTLIMFYFLLRRLVEYLESGVSVVICPSNSISVVSHKMRLGMLYVTRLHHVWFIFICFACQVSVLSGLVHCSQTCQMSCLKRLYLFLVLPPRLRWTRINSESVWFNASGSASRCRVCLVNHKATYELCTLGIWYRPTLRLNRCVFSYTFPN